MEYEALKLISEKEGLKRKWDENESTVLFTIIKYSWVNKEKSRKATNGTKLPESCLSRAASNTSGVENSAGSGGSTIWTPTRRGSCGLTQGRMGGHRGQIHHRLHSGEGQTLVGYLQASPELEDRAHGQE